MAKRKSKKENTGSEESRNNLKRQREGDKINAKRGKEKKISTLLVK